MSSFHRDFFFWKNIFISELKKRISPDWAFCFHCLDDITHICAVKTQTPTIRKSRHRDKRDELDLVVTITRNPSIFPQIAQISDNVNWNRCTVHCTHFVSMNMSHVWRTGNELSCWKRYIRRSEKQRQKVNRARKQKCIVFDTLSRIRHTWYELLSFVLTLPVHHHFPQLILLKTEFANFGALFLAFCAFEN